MRKNNLDEMQEQKLLKIEGRGMWMAFWLLCIAIAVQFCIGTTLEQIVGELVVLAVISVYIFVACLKNGIWTRNMKPATKSHALISLIPMIVIGVTFFLRAYFNASSISTKSIIFIIVLMLVAYMGCLAALELAHKAYTRKRNQLDQEEPEDQEPGNHGS